MTSGTVEHIVFTNDGFTIAKVRIGKELVTVQGNLLSPTPGEIIEMEGSWIEHPRFGRQFKVERSSIKPPVTMLGIRKYLGSGAIQGLGPAMADRIVDHFESKTFDIMGQTPHRLSEVPGLGEKRIEMIVKSWKSQFKNRDAMIFLQEYGITANLAAKIIACYRDEAVNIVKENPYRLAVDIDRVGFITADAIGKRIGIKEDASVRVEAGILYTLEQLSNSGHICYPDSDLVDRAQKVLELAKQAQEIIAKSIKALSNNNLVVIENRMIYLAKFYHCEKSIAKKIKILINEPRTHSVKPDIIWAQQKFKLTLSRDQAEAIRAATTRKVMVITGGPGTGKTTIINAILKIFKKDGAKVFLAAPTGRAAKRMSEATGTEARTVHRMLEYSPQNGRFMRNTYNLLECDAVIVDEASMIDTMLMHHMLAAIPPGSALIIVGDVNQLPSVGAGNVLKDIIESKAIPVIRLTQIFRQSKESQIIVNAHKINQGIMPATGGDFFFIERENPIETIIDIVIKHIPEKFGFDSMDDIQVLTPMHKGPVGTINLNKELQNILNPGETKYRPGDKVMQIRNNYDKGVFNGDIGRIVSIFNGETYVKFSDTEAVYDFSTIDELTHAYAISIHKSQGSEYPAVVFPIISQHSILLQRNLIYTAVTRAIKLAVIVGTQRALAVGVKNINTERRFTQLCERLQNA